MHRIIKSHLDNFSKSFGLDDLDESKQFEMFVNYAVLTPKISTTFELGRVCTTPAAAGFKRQEFTR